MSYVLEYEENLKAKQLPGEGSYEEGDSADEIM